MAARVLPEARDDLRQALRYYRDVRPPALGRQLAARMMAAFNDAVALAEMMALGRPEHPEIPGARFIPFERFPYLLTFPSEGQGQIPHEAHVGSARAMVGVRGTGGPNEPKPAEAKDAELRWTVAVHPRLRRVDIDAVLSLTFIGVATYLLVTGRP